MAISPISPSGTVLQSSSISRICTPWIGVPIEPGLRTWCGWLNEATGEVSDSPYPSRMMQPNFSSKPRRTSTGSAAPPETHTRSVAALAGSPSGRYSMAAYMVGTPSKTVTLSRCVMSSALAGSNLGSSVSVAAFATEAFSPQVSPNTWNSGRQPMTTLSGVPSSSVRAVTVALPVSPSWVSSAPLGLPVVPEVYKMTALSSPCRPDGPGAAPWTWPSTSAKSAVSAAIIWAPTSAAPLAACPAAACQDSSTLAPESFR